MALFVSVKAQQADSLMVHLTTKWNNAKGYTLAMAQLMPADKYSFKPVPDEMSFEEQLLHIANNMEWLSRSFLGVTTAKDTLKYHGKMQVMERVNRAYNAALAAHHALSSTQMNESVSFFAGPKTRQQMLVLMHDHQGHHAGQLIVYLRLNGLKPPAYIGW